MIVIDPLGTEILLPAILIGYELPYRVRRPVCQWNESPDWIVTLDLQVGGYAMYHPTVAGALLRFSDNTNHIRGDAGFLIRGFKAMAEDPDYRLLKRGYPVLERLCGTQSEYSPQQLRELERFLSPYLPLPPPESGSEAFVRLAPCEPLAHFNGWRMLQASVLPGFRTGYTSGLCPHVDDSNISGVSLRSEAVLDTAAVEQLVGLGERVEQSQLRAFLLWENCD